MRETNSGESGQITDSTSKGETREPNFGMRVLSVFIEPKVTYDYLKTKSDFWRPFILISILMAVVTFFNAPIMWEMQRNLIAAQGKQIPPQVMGDTALGIVGAIFTPVGIGVSFLISGGIVWLLGLILTGSMRFSQAISIVTYSYFPTFLAQMMNGFVVAIVRPEFSGVSNYLRDTQPALFYTSLASVFSGQILLSFILFNLSLFTLWSLYLMYLGLVRSASLKVSQAIITVCIILLLSLGMSLLQVIQLAGKLK